MMDMKKCFVAIMFLSILSFCVTSCDFSNPLDGDFFYRPNDNNASDYRDRFNSSFPNTYEPIISYDYNTYHDHCFYSIDNAPTKGNVNVLVIPVRLIDYKNDNEEQIYSDICKSFFAQSNEISFESVASYYEKSSYNNLSIGGYVTDWYDSGFKTSLSGKDTETLVKNAIEWARNKYKDKIDFSSLDSDKDGFLDAVSLIYNAPNYHNDNDNLWAYTSWVYGLRGNINKPNPKCYLWASYDFMYENIMNAQVDAHTYIHEMGHVFGLDDYYDYNKPQVAGAAGGAIMQSYNVGDHDPYSKFALGWINPLIPSDNATITLKPFSESGQTILLTNKTALNTPFDEYILIDYYTGSNLNYYDALSKYGGNKVRGPQLPLEKGIRIWHVDARLANYNFDGTKYQITSQVDDLNGRYYHLTSNSSDGVYASKEIEYRDYRLLHLIQKTFMNTYSTKQNTYFSAKEMFIEGDVFSVQRYQAVFENRTKLNDGSKLNYEIEVKSLTDECATIEVRTING